MVPVAVKVFVDQFPNGTYAEEAGFVLSLHDKIADVKAGKTTPALVIPFEKLGKRWKHWMKWNTRRAAIGAWGNESKSGMFAALGCRSGLCTDYSGRFMAPTGDGSIIVIETDGAPYAYLDDILFQSEKKGRLYFAVIHGKGLVHLQGKGKVTMPDGNETLLP